MEKNNKLIMGAIALVVGLVIGGGVGYTSGHSTKNDSQTAAAMVATTSTTTKAAGLRTLLNNLEAEHVDLASTATRNGFDGSPAFNASAAALAKNTDDLSNTIASVYGDAAGAKFKEIWTSHIGFFVDYTVAAKKGDKAGMDKAVQNLNGYVEAISTFFSEANPNLPKAAVAQLITEHVGLLKDAVDKYGAGDYAGSFDSESQARVQITTKIADTIAGAIVKQNPSKF